MGYGTAEGYGRLQLGKDKVLAHRLSFERFVGAIPDGMLVLHHCDMPCCVNPAHLFFGTDISNTADKMAKGRHARGPEHSKWSRGELQHMCKLTEDRVRAIRGDLRTQKEIAADYGISQTNVGLIQRRMTWKHV